jgi:hypothetical protein
MAGFGEIKAYIAKSFHVERVHHEQEQATMSASKRRGVIEYLKSPEVLKFRESCERFQRDGE